MPDFVPLAERIVDALLDARPRLASETGDHRADDRLPDLSAGAVAADVAMLRDAAHALSEVDDFDLEPAEQVDHALLSSLVEGELFALTEVREHEWNPLTHNPGDLLHGLIARPFAPADVRLTALAGRLTVDDDPGRDPRLGSRLWAAKLWHTLDTELSATQVLDRAWANLDRVTGEIRAVAAELVGGPATDGTVRRALAQLAAEHPDNSSIVDRARVALAETTDFVREHDLVSLVADPCVIEEMPEFARGVAVAYCDAPGPLETTTVPTFYCIAPTPADWPTDRVESFYREYNNHMVRNLTVHEAMPGHFLQLAHARRYRGTTRVRALTGSGPFVEGWAVYAEELMAGLGYGGPAIRMQQLKMQLRMTINAILDQLTHCAELSEADGMELMTVRGFQEEGEAAGKWRRALLTSTQLSTYFVGYAEVAEIAASRSLRTPLGRWHDAMLAHGSPPPRLLRTLLGV